MSAASTSQKPPQVFEFTKRKNWAGLLVTELADAIILLLSSTGHVLFCGAAITEILGWRDVDLVDNDFLNLVSYTDQMSFRASFEESIRTRTDLLAYVHLQCRNPPSSSTSPGQQDILFEIKGHPHFVADEPSCRLFFAMAKPHPSRCENQLNSFLELKMQQEHLLQQLADLKARGSSVTSTSHSQNVGLLTAFNAVYNSTNVQTVRSMPQHGLMGHPQERAADHGSHYLTGLSQGGYKAVYTSPVATMFDPSQIYNVGSHGYPAHSVPSTYIEDEAEDTSKKKKLKKAHSAEQYVCITCGRTDSPEWRKGPLGPKTLCNACGLRWAKQMRKYDEPSETQTMALSASEGTVASVVSS